MRRFNHIPRWFLVLIVVFALLKLWLVSDLSIVAIGAAGHDDRLFLNLAVSLLRGEWLGPYNVLTLAKGPFYSMWIAFNFVAGFPLLIAQQVLYILATLFFAITIRPLFHRLLPLTVLYVVVLFNPMTYSWHCLRVTREGIYPALTIFVLAGAIAIMLRVNGMRARYFSMSVVTGFLLSAFWLTREEGIWVVPSLLILIIWTLVKGIRNKNVLRPLIACSLPCLVLILGLGAVATLNFFHYGVFTTVEFKARAFLDAYGALCRVKPANWIPDVPVPRETRLRLYALSSAFAELEPFLEGEIGRGWTRKYPDEIPGGWFMWALRDAVAAAGYGTSGAGAMSFYQRMAEQINSACGDGRIDCLGSRSSMLPPWRADYNGAFFHTFMEGIYYTATYQDFSAGRGQSQGPDKLLVLFRDLTRSPVYPPRIDDHGANYGLKKADSLPAQTHLAEIKRNVLGVMGKGYQFAVLWLAVAGVVVYLFSVFQSCRKRQFSDGFIIATALLAAIVMRVLVLSLISITSFPAIDALYLSPAYPLLLLFLILALSYQPLTETTSTMPDIQHA